MLKYGPGCPAVVEGPRAPRTGSKRVLFLDRDGVINVNHGYVHRPEDTEWVDGIFELCTVARDMGYGLVVVTNQAGIARGLYSNEEFGSYTDWMQAQFAQRELPLLGTYYCQHHPAGNIELLAVRCDCRKPAPGMFLAAKEHYDIDMAHSAMVGDQPSDMIAAAAAGIRYLFMLEGTNEDLRRGLPFETLRIENLRQAASLLITLA